MTSLKLIAFDQDDLDIISAHLQDAVGCVRDIAWLPRELRFVMVLNRFCWETAVDGTRTRADFERRQTALHFERVRSVRRRRIAQTKPEGVLNLLAVRFVPGEAPAGAIELVFSSDAAIRLEVECIEAALSDLGPAWSTQARPTHALSETAEGT